MKRYVKHMLILCCMLISAAAQSQVVVQINAGSRAMWGTNQNLYIDQQGHCQFYLSEARGPVKDSASFSISTSQLASFFDKANQVDFFHLKNKYDAGLADGSGLFISLNSSGQKHSVDLRNMDIPPIHALIEQLNQLLAPHHIQINYGQ